MKITDQNITSIKFWCIFNNKEYNDFFEYFNQQFKSVKKFAAKKPAAKKTTSSKSENLQESFKSQMSKAWSGIKTYVGAKSKKIFNAGIKNNSIAYMKFTCAKKDYTVTYNMKKKAWYLYYTDFGMFNTDSIPTDEEAQSLLKTEYFTKFVEKCKESVLRIIDNDTAFNILQKAMLVAGNNSAAKYLQEVKESKEDIKSTMFKVEEIKT